MKAVIYEKFGARDVLKLATVPKPSVKGGEVLVRVRACALNRIDIYLREEEDPDIPMPHISGSDIAGKVAKTGGVRGWRAKEPVIISPSLPSGILGYQTQGGYARVHCCSGPKSFKEA